MHDGIDAAELVDWLDGYADDHGLDWADVDDWLDDAIAEYGQNENEGY